MAAGWKSPSLPEFWHKQTVLNPRSIFKTLVLKKCRQISKEIISPAMVAARFYFGRSRLVAVSLKISLIVSKTTETKGALSIRSQLMPI